MLSTQLTSPFLAFRPPGPAGENSGGLQSAMALILQLIIFNIFLTPVVGAPVHNVTLSVSDGFTNHGNNDLYCTPSQWHDVLTFFAINYASHAATVKSRPGQTYMHTARDVALTLIYPFTGLMRALESFARSSYSANDLRKAARAGALCMIVRNKDWKPSWRTRILARMPSIHAQDIELRVKQEENVSGITKPNEAPSMQEDPDFFAQSSVDKAPGCLSRLRSFLDKSNIWTRNIHGECMIPEGYSVAILPSNATMASSSHQDLDNVTISCSHSIPKVVIAIVQVIYAIITVYRTRGDKIDRFGYAAFGFTVLPYIVMSLMNLLGALLLPDYPTLYIVRSLESDEATLLGGTVDGTAGRLVQRKDDYLNFLRDSSIRKADGEHDVNCTDERDMTANRSIRIGSRQSHIEEDSPRLTYKSARHVKYLKSNPPGQHASYIPFARNGEAETWHVMTSKWHRNPKFAKFAVRHVFSAIPLTVIGGMSHFRRGHSTRAQCAWTMTWLACNFFFGGNFGELFDPSLSQRGMPILLMLALAVPAIGGFVTVGQMIQQYGSCTVLGDL